MSCPKKKQIQFAFFSPFIVKLFQMHCVPMEMDCTCWNLNLGFNASFKISYLPFVMSKFLCKKTVLIICLS